MLKKNRAAFFLDRDGVIIRNVPYLNNIKEAEFLPRIDRAIRKINDSGYKCIVITNQSGVARGIISLDQLFTIHEYVQNSLAEVGARIDAFYYCPHHPEGKVKKYAIRCECRKPKTGMLIRAAKDFDLDLSECIMVGDQRLDVVAGERAGCKSFRVSPMVTLAENRPNIFGTLEQVVDHVINLRKELVQ